jgi:hypothetical protein
MEIHCIPMHVIGQKENLAPCQSQERVLWFGALQPDHRTGFSVQEDGINCPVAGSDP